MIGISRIVGGLTRPRLLLKYKGKYYLKRSKGEQVFECQYGSCSILFEHGKSVAGRFYNFVYDEYVKNYFGAWVRAKSEPLRSEKEIKMERVE